MQSVLFLQSNKEQTYTFIKFLKPTKRFEFFFDKTSKYDKNKEFDIVVPCGAVSTSVYFMTKGELKIGQMDFAENNFITYDDDEKMFFIIFPNAESNFWFYMKEYSFKKPVNFDYVFSNFDFTCFD